MRRSVGVVAALTAEAAALGGTRIAPGRIVESGSGLSLLVSGMGPEAAAQAALRLVDAGVAALAVFGVAGGLDPRLAPGDLVCPSEILDEQNQRYAAESSWRGHLLARLPLPPQTGALLSVKLPLLSAAEKSAAFKSTGAVAVDMESAAVAAVAASAGLPFLALRAISDAAADAIPVALAATVDRYGRPQAGRVAATLLRKPSLVAGLPKLSGGMNAALQALRQAAQASKPDLAYTLNVSSQ